ncbi:MAG: hypothetical protein QW838_02955 [Candidatus Nitrosotenuis sp.]
MNERQELVRIFQEIETKLQNNSLCECQAFRGLRLLLRHFVTGLTEFDHILTDQPLSLEDREIVGLCDVESKKIYISKKTSFLERCSAVIHELLHAGFPHEEHDRIYQLANVAEELIFKPFFPAEEKEKEREA